MITYVYIYMYIYKLCQILACRGLTMDVMMFPWSNAIRQVLGSAFLIGGCRHKDGQRPWCHVEIAGKCWVLPCFAIKKWWMNENMNGTCGIYRWCMRIYLLKLVIFQWFRLRSHQRWLVENWWKWGTGSLDALDWWKAHVLEDATTNENSSRKQPKDKDGR